MFNRTEKRLTYENLQSKDSVMQLYKVHTDMIAEGSDSEKQLQFLTRLKEAALERLDKKATSLSDLKKQLERRQQKIRHERRRFRTATCGILELILNGGSVKKFPAGSKKENEKQHLDLKYFNKKKPLFDKNVEMGSSFRFALNIKIEDGAAEVEKVVTKRSKNKSSSNGTIKYKVKYRFTLDGSHENVKDIAAELIDHDAEVGISAASFLHKVGGWKIKQLKLGSVAATEIDKEIAPYKVEIEDK